MPTINKELADELVEKVSKQRRPKYYCILKYKNPSTGNWDYAYCMREEKYQEVLVSPFVTEVEILWSSERFQKTHISEKTGEERDERPPYPKRKTCNCKKQGCGTEPEWEWQEFEDVWTCLGCGMAIIGKTGKDVFASEEDKEDAENEQTPKPDKKFKKGDKVAIAVHGAGVTSYEPHIVERISRGIVYLEGKEDFVFDANTGWRTRCEPSPFGFSFQLVTKAEVSATEWKRRCKDFGIDP